MVEIDKIYLFETIDKNPYVFVPDSNAFGTVTVNSTIPYLLDALQLVASNAIKLDSCFKAYFDYDMDLDFENQTPFEGAIPYKSGGIYNYRLRLVRENSDKAFGSSFDRYSHYLATKTWQIVFHTITGEWFICYAEFSLVNTTINNEIIHDINFEAVDSKEEKFLITALTEI